MHLISTIIFIGIRKPQIIETMVQLWIKAQRMAEGLDLSPSIQNTR
jgi:hypothetical protein